MHPWGWICGWFHMSVGASNSSQPCQVWPAYVCYVEKWGNIGQVQDLFLFVICFPNLCPQYFFFCLDFKDRSNNFCWLDRIPTICSTIAISVPSGRARATYIIWNSFSDSWRSNWKGDIPSWICRLAIQAMFTCMMSLQGPYKYMNTSGNIYIISCRFRFLYNKVQAIKG